MKQKLNLCLEKFFQFDEASKILEQEKNNISESTDVNFCHLTLTLTSCNV